MKNSCVVGELEQRPRRLPGRPSTLEMADRVVTRYFRQRGAGTGWDLVLPRRIERPTYELRILQNIQVKQYVTRYSGLNFCPQLSATAL
jgi:hypothetical protein